MAGQPLWTDEEIAICREIGHDYKALMKALNGRRSYHSVRNQCQKLGLAPKRHIWLGAELAHLRRIYPKCSWEDILAAFPFATRKQIKHIAKHYKIYREKRPFKPTGIPGIDQVRNRCFELNLSMPDVDALAKSKSYFCKGRLARGPYQLQGHWKGHKGLGWRGDGSLEQK
ncbi:hypothetical protein [Phyllobacterium lublinensis]|uniref:hypothetical protein n=1 Tax=Phyllobacterium lublinensis TaxID=2875708 RepID=UPI001CCD99FE|nr:hypothetical protein [Phyllobacterium sp. 2063]MBZ9655038.1 hypothetical protein [Phyllobacterium sp. 2063]